MAVQSGEIESGTEGKLKVGNLHLYVYSWRLTSDPELKPTRNAETGGINTRSPVGRDYTLKFQVYISTGHQPDHSTLTTQNLLEGSQAYLSLRVGTLQAYGNGTNTWKFRIGPIDLVGNDANGFAVYDVTAYAQEAKPALGNWAD